MIAQNLEIVRLRIAKALEQSRRPPGSARLVVVSKTILISGIREAIQAGAIAFGENKVQEARSKILELKQQKLTWYLIGHLQRNKVKYIFDLFDRIDSVDSVELAESIHHFASKRGTVMPVLIQVNIAREEAKFGVEPEDLESLLRKVSKMSGIRVDGLMTITPKDPDPEKARPHYARLKELRDRMDSLKIENIKLRELSMGMTNDYIIAVEEGATMVRVGTAIFGKR